VTLARVWVHTYDVGYMYLIRISVIVAAQAPVSDSFLSYLTVRTGRHRLSMMYRHPGTGGRAPRWCAFRRPFHSTNELGSGGANGDRSSGQRSGEDLYDSDIEVE